MTLFSSKVTKRLETKDEGGKLVEKKILKVHIEKFKAELLKRKKIGQEEQKKEKTDHCRKKFHFDRIFKLFLEKPFQSRHFR